MKNSVIHWLIPISLFLLLLVDLPVYADEREEPVDLIIALDKSLSMEEEIAAVKEYVNTRIIDDVLQNGDFFLVIAFFGRAPVVISDYIQGDAQKAELKQKISALRADGDWTDIGNALDKLRDEVETHSAPNRKKTLLLMTDGKHEPPPGSKYYSKDGTVSHEYLRETSETQKLGWKIIVLGFGQESPKEIADSILGRYVESPGKMPDPIGTIKIEGDATVKPVLYNGRSELKLHVVTDLYEQPVDIVITKIGVETEVAVQDNLLSTPFEIQLPAEGEATLRIPLYFSKDFEPGAHSGKFIFSFSSTEQLDPNLFIDFRVNSLVENFWWAIPVVVALLALAFLIIWKVASAKTLVFRFIVTEKPLRKGKDTFKIRAGKELFVKESMDFVDLATAKTTKSLAKLSLTDQGLSMTVMKEDRFPDLKSNPRDVIDKTFIVRTESGKDFTVRFVKV